MRALSRLSAIRDSRQVVRSLFLSSAARTGLPDRPGFTLAEAVADVGAGEAETVRSWLAVGVALGELRLRDGRYLPRGRRWRAIAADPFLRDHYRSVTEYQTGTYDALLSGAERGDLGEFAATIAGVSRAAEPFTARFVRASVPPDARVLDVGCGTGVYLRAALDGRANTGVGIDLSPEVVAGAAANLTAWGLDGRASVEAADLREYTGGPFGAVTLLNCVYYFRPTELAGVFAHVRSLLAPGGRLVLVTMARENAVAAAHLDLMLRVQDVPAGLHTMGAIATAMREAGFGPGRARRLVPGQPFWGLTAS
ncbi:methyltransferase [Actinorhabdospora filicis]|uniref:Methyltransferase n=1 Tax=Actinorhabdospora filicis TaxID=1785913 RepID=A0A9W6W8U4_9ACTN|nr:class I SAM-dependent methyltransferase [Actinorhabdospora filicis]GLZ76010.1 methyltransferase [Actinorhabdospora filicis]